MAKEQASKKKSKKIVSDGIAHIHATFNNTIVMITDVMEIPFAGQLLAELVLEVQESQLLLQLKLQQVIVVKKHKLSA